MFNARQHNARGENYNFGERPAGTGTLAVNARSRNGLLYDQNGDGVISGSEAGLRTTANDVFGAINEAGGI